MTWMLWKALRYPQWKHPIFRYAQQEKISRKPLAWTVYFLLVLLGLAFVGFAAFFPIFAILSLFAVGFGVPALILVFNGTALGLYWVGAIAEAIARESRHGRSDLLNLVPDGAFGANWQIAMGVLHRNDWFNTVYRLMRSLVMAVAVILGLISLMLILGAVFSELSQQRENQIRILLEVLGIGLMAFYFWIDHIQSIILALLAGLILPYFQREEAMLKLLSIILFLLPQCLLYLLGAALYLGLSQVVGNSTGLMNLVIMLVGILLFCGFRELLIRGLWSYYLRLSQATDAAQIVRI